MQLDPPPLEYLPAEVQPEALGLRRDGGDLVIVIAPVHPVRLMLAQLIPIGGLVVLILFLVFALFVASRNGADETVILGLPVVTCGVLLLVLLRRFIPVARFGRLPAVFRASRYELLLNVPTLGRRGRKQWPTSRIADISIRHAGAFPVLLRLIRLQVSSEDQTDVVLIPSPGGESLGELENSLRDAIGLPVFSE
jgi:hypothetical protein